MSASTGSQGKFHERYAWVVLFSVGVLLALSAAYIMLAGVDPSDFESATGITWSGMQASQPEVSLYLNRLERLTGAGMLGFALLGAAVAWTSFRNGQRWAWYAMLSFPFVFGLVSVIFMAHDSVGLAIFYGAGVLLTALGIVLPIKKFF